MIPYFFCFLKIDIWKLYSEKNNLIAVHFCTALCSHGVCSFVRSESKELHTSCMFTILLLKHLRGPLAGKLGGVASCHAVIYIASVTYIEDITRLCEDMNFIFEWWKQIFYERAQRVSKILFSPRENKIHIFKPPCYVLFII